MMIKEADHRLPPYFHSLDEVARAGRLSGTPSKQGLMCALQDSGYAVAESHLEVRRSCLRLL